MFYSAQRLTWLNLASFIKLRIASSGYTPQWELPHLHLYYQLDRLPKQLLSNLFSSKSNLQKRVRLSLVPKQSIHLPATDLDPDIFNIGLP